MSGLHVQPPLGSSSFAPFSEVEKIHPKIGEKRPISQNMRQNDPQRAPPGTLKRGQKCLKILKKVTLGVSWETPWPQSGPGGSQGPIFNPKLLILCSFFYVLFIAYCVSSILFLMCCSMVSVLYISKRSKQNNQSKQSNHRKSRKASKACKVSKAHIFCIFVDVVGGLFCICLLKL